MKVLVATDAHIYEMPDGSHWTPAIYGYSFWKRYLNIFDSVRIVARTKKVDNLQEKALLVDGPGVEIFSVPFYQGPTQLLKKYFAIHKSLVRVADGCDVAIFRVPSQTAFMALSHVHRKMPVGGEVVYDPTDDLHRKNVNAVVRILDYLTSFKLKAFCKSANGVAYVTEHSIQNHYPSRARLKGRSDNYFETFYSTITLNEDAFGTPRKFQDKANIVLSFSNVAMNSVRKGEPVLLRAVQMCRSRGYDVRCLLIGDGNKKKEFEKLAVDLGISAYTEFTGRLASSEEVRQRINDTDIFVFPSQAEGLPRGVLEAMAVGLPVLSTPVGGIPEVINSKYLIDPLNADGFADMIMHLFDNQEELTQMSYTNFSKACEFSNIVLQKKRDEFYKDLASIKR